LSLKINSITLEVLNIIIFIELRPVYVWWSPIRELVAASVTYSQSHGWTDIAANANIERCSLQYAQTPTPWAVRDNATQIKDKNSILLFFYLYTLYTIYSFRNNNNMRWKKKIYIQSTLDNSKMDRPMRSLK